MENKTIVYVSGNPNAYPVEYYNPETQTYEGMIPELLRRFSDQSGYELVYYQCDGRDNREQLGKNNQVDILSGYLQTEGIPDGTADTVVFHATQNGQYRSYTLHFTGAAPEALKAELQSFLGTVSQEEISGLLLQNAALPASTGIPGWTVGILSAIIVLLLVLIAIAGWRFRKKLKKIQDKADTDWLTGLGNMNYLMRHHRQFVNDKNFSLYQLLYFYIDTDHLSQMINRQEVDEFLKTCTGILQVYTHHTDLLTRVSAYGFVLLKFNSSLEQTEEMVCTILNQFRKYPKLQAENFEVRTASGIYPFQSKAYNLEEMVYDAAQGAYVAVREKKDYEIFSDRIVEKINEEKQLQLTIEKAFEKKEFDLYIQFYVDADSGQVVGGEALSRWNHPQKGILTAGEFVGLLKQRKMISRLDAYCLRESCAFLERLVQDKVETFFLSCNLSGETLVEADFLDRFSAMLAQYQFPRELLILEITEDVLAENCVSIQQQIRGLKELGVSILLDNVRKGLTVFYSLRDCPVDGIKLDKSLIDQTLTQEGKAILKAVVQIGHELGMTVLAEGVEQDEQAEILKTVHCDVLQGYRFAFPLPHWEVQREILEENLLRKATVEQ